MMVKKQDTSQAARESRMLLDCSFAASSKADVGVRLNWAPLRPRLHRHGRTDGPAETCMRGLRRTPCTEIQTEQEQR